MTMPQELHHPGPRAAQRFTALPCRAAPIELRLAAGLPFDQAVTNAFAEAGFGAGYLRLAGARFSHLTYVIPAPAPGDGRAAWYSETHVLTDAVIADAGIHHGRKNGAPFQHCHGLWGCADTPLRMGHLLAPDSVLAEDAVVTGWGLTGAALEVTADPETGFDLFAPVATGDPGVGLSAVLCKLQPNEDPHSLLSEVAPGFSRARIEGIGSLVNTRFETHRQESYATEVLLQDGQMTGDGAVMLNAASVGFDGEPMTGPLRAHENRICITAELLLIEE